MRFAVSLFVFAVGAILLFGVTATPSGVNIAAIGVILMLVGLAGLAIGHWLYVARRRTDVIYRPDGQTWIEPNAPPHDPTDTDL
jgi:xanthosine utilization system XapX-like protein